MQEHTWRSIPGKGIAPLDVFFEAGDDPRRLVMAYGDNPRAYRWGYCGAIVLPPDGTGDAFGCLSCGRLILPGETTCRSCGWSYQPAQDSDAGTRKT